MPSAPESAAVAFYVSLEALAAEGRLKDMPHGTGAVLCDARLAVHLERETAIDREAFFVAFVAAPARPVRECHGVTRWALGKGGDAAEKERLILGKAAKIRRKVGQHDAARAIAAFRREGEAGVAPPGKRRDWTQDDESARAAIARSLGRAS